MIRLVKSIAAALSRIAAACAQYVAYLYARLKYGNAAPMPAVVAVTEEAEFEEVKERSPEQVIMEDAYTLKQLAKSGLDMEISDELLKKLSSRHKKFFLSLSLSEQSQLADVPLAAIRMHLKNIRPLDHVRRVDQLDQEPTVPVYGNSIRTSKIARFLETATDEQRERVMSRLKKIAETDYDIKTPETVAARMMN